MLTLPARSDRHRLGARHVLGLPVALILLVNLIGISTVSAQSAPATAVASPAASPGATPEIALASSIAPASAAGTDQIVLSNTVVTSGTTSWKITTPLPGQITFRSASCNATGTTCDSTYDPGTNTVTTSGTLAAGSPRGQATIRIVGALVGGTKAGSITIPSCATTGDATTCGGAGTDGASATLAVAVPHNARAVTTTTGTSSQGAATPAAVTTGPTSQGAATAVPAAATTTTGTSATPVPGTTTTSASPVAATAATPAAGNAGNAGNEIALSSVINPATASGSDQVILSQHLVATGSGSWTVRTPLTGNVIYRGVSCDPTGTTCDSTYDAATNTLVTTGTIDSGAARGQATIRIVAAVIGGAQAANVAIASCASFGDVACGPAGTDSAIALLKVGTSANAAIPATSGGIATTNGTPTSSSATTSSGNATTATTGAASTPVPATPVSGAASVTGGGSNATPAGGSPSSSATTPAAAAPTATTAAAAPAAAQPTAAPTATPEAGSGSDNSNRNLTIIIVIAAVLVGGLGLGALRNLRAGGNPFR